MTDTTEQSDITFADKLVQNVFEALWTSLDEDLLNNLSTSAMENLVVRLASSVQGGASVKQVKTQVNELLRVRKHVLHLKSLPFAPQRSAEWLALRKNLLTASDLAQAIGKGKMGSRNALLLKKTQALLSQDGLKRFYEINPPTASSMSTSSFSSAPLRWGVMFEEMIARSYCQRNMNIPLYDFGLIPHPTLKCFGASPDGITAVGKMLEIKCPWRRKITMGEVPEHYYLQVQGQLSVCSLNECDYVEAVIEDFQRESDYTTKVPPSETTQHGVLIELQHPSQEEAYEYSPEGLTPKEAYAWARTRAMEIIKETPDITIMKIHPWRVKEMNIVAVSFDPILWDKLIPQIQLFWKDVLELRDKYESGEAMEPRKKKKIELISGGTTGVSPPKSRGPKFMYRDDDEPVTPL